MRRTPPELTIGFSHQTRRGALCASAIKQNSQIGESKPPPYVKGNGATLASLCRGRGTTKWWWESFKGKVAFPTNRREQDSRPTLRATTGARSAPLQVCTPRKILRSRCSLEDDARVNNLHKPSDSFAPLFQKREPKRLERFIVKLTFYTSASSGIVLILCL